MKLRKNRRTQWTEEEKEKLRNLFVEYEGDVVVSINKDLTRRNNIVRISKELRRGERSVRMNLFFMGLIGEGEVDDDESNRLEAKTT